MIFLGGSGSAQEMSREKEKRDHREAQKGVHPEMQRIQELRKRDGDIHL
jgi:hypothetical protein